MLSLLLALVVQVDADFPGGNIVVDKIDGDAGASVTLGDVLLAGEGSELKGTSGLTVVLLRTTSASALPCWPPYR